jgi:hypothetical protein
MGTLGLEGQQLGLPASQELWSEEQEQSLQPSKIYSRTADNPVVRRTGQTAPPCGIPAARPAQDRSRLRRRLVTSPLCVHPIPLTH